MNFFKNLPIRVKLHRLTMLSSSVAVAVAGLAIVVFQGVTFRHQIERESAALALEIGYYSAAALLFQDADDAQHALAGLASRPNIEAGTLYDRFDAVLAQYRRTGSTLDAAWCLPIPEPDMMRFHQGYLQIFRAVEQDGKKIGTLYLLADLRSMYALMLKYLMILVAVLLGSLLVAWGISARLQGQISQPILKLSEAVKKISREKDYAIQVEAESTDETGMLTRAFNDMLQEIRRRDDELLAAQELLEKRVEERTHELKQANIDLQHSINDLEQFAAIASHDLQEPLRMIGSYLQMLEKKYRGRLDAEADEYIDFAVSGAVRLQTLINDLLTYSRIGMRGQQHEPVDMQALVEELQLDLANPIRNARAEITTGPLPTLMADGMQLKLLVRNLVSNGIKFREEAPPRIHIDCMQKGNETVFSVQDNGLGISPEYQDRVFKIFQRLHSASEIPGTGIGLAICQKVVERHGGDIWLESEPGKGTTVYFSIPAQPRYKRKERTPADDLFRLAMAAAPHGMLLVNQQGTITLANPALERMYGYGPAELVGQSIEILVPSRMRDLHGKLRALYRAEPRDRSMSELSELNGQHRDGHEFPVAIGLNPVATPQGPQVLATVVDRSEYARARGELQAKADLLLRQNTDLEHFASTVAHDLQEPLRMIFSYMQLLEKEYGDQLDAAAREYIGFSVEGAQRLSSMVKDLQSFARIGTRTSPFIDINLNVLMEEVRLQLASQIEASGAVIAIDALPEIQGDLNQIKQLFVELLVNAIKFKGNACPRIQVQADEGAEAVQFSVKDNGCGIPASARERVFQIFQRLTTRDAIPGNGIGLAICRKIMDRHSGKIWVESEEGQGSIFYFTLPRQSKPDNERGSIQA